MDPTIVPEFNSWLEELVGGHGSDLHVKVGSPPMVRMPQGLERLDRDALTAIETQAIAEGIIPEDRKATFLEKGEVDFAYSVPNVGRFRANVFRQRNSISMVLRKLRFGGPSFEEVGLPDAIRTIADEHRGLILVTGPTGSGKTTTLAAMIDYINKTKPVHIVTIEDSDRGPAQGPPGVDQPARGRARHRGLPVGPAGRAPSGPRRDPHR